MTVEEYANKMNMEILTGKIGLGKQISGMYICDLLSWVMSHARKGEAWITVLTNLNVVAVALLTEVSCVIIPEGIGVEDQTINKAISEEIPILRSNLNSYHISKKSSGLIGG